MSRLVRLGKGTLAVGGHSPRLHKLGHMPLRACITAHLRRLDSRLSVRA